jgi:hypothetical protein
VDTAPAPGATVALSDELTKSRWAHVEEAVVARRAPGDSAAPVRDHKGRPKRLNTHVPDTSSPEVVLALNKTVLDGGEEWVEVRLPMRPNNTTGWVPRDALGPLRTAHGHLLIDRGKLRATLYDSAGKRRWSAAIGVGVSRWPTPEGRFYVRERLVVPRGSRAGYGPFAFGTSALSPTLSGGNWGEGVIGLHGTGQPGLLPGRVSHGCVRVKNRKVLQLRRLMGLGTPIRIV